MEPDNNMQNSAGTSVANAPIAGAPTTPPTENIMAQGVPGNNSVSDDKKSKMSKKNIVGLIVLSLIAVGGVLFGVYGMNSQNEQIADLKVQVSDANGKVAQLETEKVTITEPNGTTTEITDDVNIVTVNSNDYIYVGEWGLKIGLADELELATYTYDYGSGYTVLSVSGATKDGQMVPDFASVKKCSLGSVERYSVANVNAGAVPDWYGMPFMTDNEYNYYYNSPQAVCTDTQGNQQWELNTAEVIKNMLTSPENYSAI